MLTCGQTHKCPGLTGRKRPFSVPRLAGAPLGVLRRVVALESAVPLGAVAAVSAGTGFLASGLFLRSGLPKVFAVSHGRDRVTCRARGIVNRI